MCVACVLRVLVQVRVVGADGRHCVHCCVVLRIFAVLLCACCVRVLRVSFRVLFLYIVINGYLRMFFGVLWCVIGFLRDTCVGLCLLRVIPVCYVCV